MGQCLSLIEKITERITCWSSKFLSYGGRLQLIKSMPFGVQTYWAQIFILPKKIMKHIDAICRYFLWTGDSQIKKRSLVSWEKVCTSQSAGGLNVKNIMVWNKAAICKHLWNIGTEKQSLWVKRVHAYYVKGNEIDQVDPRNVSWVLRKIFSCKQIVLDKVRGVDLPSKLISLQKNGRYCINIAYSCFIPAYPKVM